jgi:hypothetical protein
MLDKELSQEIAKILVELEEADMSSKGQYPLSWLIR